MRLRVVWLQWAGMGIDIGQDADGALVVVMIMADHDMVTMVILVTVPDMVEKERTSPTR
jgi:hypothetical protein